MNLEGMPTPPLPNVPSTEDLACKLVEIQRLKIEALESHNKALMAANKKLAGELLAASEQRADALVDLQDKVHVLKTQTQVVCAQRDAVEQALRSLCQHLANQPITSLTYFGGDQFAKSVREAKEVLHLVDQAKARAGK